MQLVPEMLLYSTYVLLPMLLQYCLCSTAYAVLYCRCATDLQQRLAHLLEVIDAGTEGAGLGWVKGDELGQACN
jgi:hypothetical protein